MSMENKTRFEVQKILRDNILAGMSALGITAEGWTVMEANQTPPTAKTDYITFRMLSSARSGWQFGNGVWSESEQTWLKTNEFIEVQEWEITVVKRQTGTNARLATDFTAEDIVQSLKFWFNGEGCDYFRRNGRMSNLWIKDEQQKEIKDDSAVNQKPNTFRISLCVPRKVITRHNVAEELSTGIYPI